MNSSLVDYTLLSPNYTTIPNKVNKKITIHHMAGDLSVETCGKLFYSKSRKASSNYGIDTEGRVGLYVDESNRSWASSSSQNDSQAVTIEVANNTLAPTWTISDEAYEKLIELCVDICRRNNIKELTWTGDTRGSLTCHFMFKNTSCPGPYLISLMPKIAETVTKKLNNHPLTQSPALTRRPVDYLAIYNALIHNNITSAGACGILGNLEAESSLNPLNLQNSYNKQFNLSDSAYTDLVDSKKHDFSNDKAGYGLAQWTFHTRKQSLLNFLSSQNLSVGDGPGQVDYLVHELKTNYKSLYNRLTSIKSVEEASDIFLTQFERPADQSEAVKHYRRNLSMKYYELINQSNPVPSPAVLAASISAASTLSRDQFKRFPVLVKISIDNLNIRKGPGTNTPIVKKITPGVYTIIKSQEGPGSIKGWGLLKSKTGWISLDYCTIAKL